VILFTNGKTGWEEEAEHLMKTNRQADAHAIYFKILKFNKNHTRSLLRVGMGAILQVNEHQSFLGSKMLTVAFSEGGYPRPADIDTQSGYEAATILGYHYFQLGDYDNSKKWFRRATLSQFPHNDCWDLFSVGIIPRFPFSQKKADEVMEKWHRNMDRFLNKQNIGLDHMACLLTAFPIAYYQTDMRAALSKYSKLMLQVLPGLQYRAPFVDTTQKTSSERRIRVGFVWCDIQNKNSIYGSFGHMIKRLPLEIFDITLIYYNTPQAGPFRQDQIALSESPQNDVFLSPFGPQMQNVPEAYEKIAAKQLDVIVYLDLFMASEMHLLAAAKLAPIQAVTHGHPVTSGLPREKVDYFISWGAAEIPSAQLHYSEKLIRIPSNVVFEYFEPRSSSKETSLIDGKHWGKYNRTNLDFLTPQQNQLLQNHAHWYFCSQASFKLHVTFDTILRNIQLQDPQAIIILINNIKDLKDMERPFYKRLQFNGVQFDRLVFLNKLMHSQLMALLKNSNVVLDSVWFGGDTTTREAFEVGSPIVTLPGQMLGERWTQAYYKAIGVTHLIAKSPEEYVRLAVRIANSSNEEQLLLRTQIKELAMKKLFRRNEAIDAWSNVLQTISLHKVQVSKEEL